MILVDTTIWIDLFNGRETTRINKLEDLIGARADLCTCGVILTEVLQGIRNETEFQRTMKVLLNLLYLPMNQSTYIQAANIYRKLRTEGITIRKPIDCMIASVCLENEVTLIHNDKDFTFIAQCFPLQMVE
ncbi:MAG: PIN domain nuclease [SAR324 cluster bacterium]|nr:PIN domain nuclease [SAR324 cluster bacterium]